MKKMMIVTLILFVILACCACGSAVPSAGVSGTSGTLPQVTAAVPVSEQDASEALMDLVKQACRYAEKGDEKGFASLWRNASDAAIHGRFEDFAEINEQAYPDAQTYVVCSAGQSFYCQLLMSYTTSHDGKTNATWDYYDFVISNSKGKWYFDGDETVFRSLDDAFVGMVPPALVEAAEAGRNYVTFRTFDRSWTRKDVIIPGLEDTRVYAFWQNEDGSITILLNSKNGRDYILTENRLAFTITDEAMGTVADRSVDLEITLLPGKSRTYTVTVDPADVLTGTSHWNGLSIDYTNYFD